MAADTETMGEHVLLEPFIHQVGGSSSMFCLDDITICKPLIPREQKFYETMPEELKDFVPEYRGITSILLKEEDGYLTLMARLPKTYQRYTRKLPVEDVQDVKMKNDGCKKPQHRIRLKKSGGFVIESHAGMTDPIFKEDGRTDGACYSPHNPWVLHCHRQRLAKLGILSPSSPYISTQSVILLESLTCKYRLPCILDVKLGIRQHGDDASPAKRVSHEAKVASTTSATVGARICGMQVYHPDCGYYVCHNKYHGRTLTADGFRETLLQFLCSGNRPRTDVIPVLIEKLQKLHDILSKLNTYRFFSSSLLIIYDGIDPAPTYSAFSNGNSSDEDEKVQEVVDNGNGKPSVSDSSDTLAPSASVHLIDFAHATHREIGGAIQLHVGPDEGCLFGLKNIISLLKSIESENL